MEIKTIQVFVGKLEDLDREIDLLKKMYGKEADVEVLFQRINLDIYGKPRG